MVGRLVGDGWKVVGRWSGGGREVVGRWSGGGRRWSEVVGEWLAVVVWGLQPGSKGVVLLELQVFPYLGHAVQFFTRFASGRPDKPFGNPNI